MKSDQINTGIGGSFFGEALFRMSSLVLERESGMSPWVRELAAAVISPPVGINRIAFGERYRTIFPSHDIAAREYYVSRVVGSGRGGHENIARVDAALTWRVKGRHGISLKYLGNYRDAYYPDL